eukprot:456437-Hanusia_phi.AAC.1
MLPYHPNPLPSCHPAEAWTAAALAASDPGPAAPGTHHARTIPSAIAAQTNTPDPKEWEAYRTVPEPYPQ